MKWSEDYATGVELDSLTLYCRGHFGFEEQCMRKFRCPVAEKNEKAHQTFLETLSKFQKRYAANGYNYNDARELVDTVDQWLDYHICHIDVHLKRCVTR